MVEIYDANTGLLLTFDGQENLELFEKYGSLTFSEARALAPADAASVNGSFLYFD